MDELKGCFLWVLAIVGWFILWGACMYIGDSSGISPFLILLIFVGIAAFVGGGGFFIYLRIADAKKKKKLAKADEIKRKHPLAFNQFVTKLKQSHSYSSTLSDIEIAEKAIKHPYEKWGEEEKKLIQEAKRRKEEAEKSAEIARKYPHGIEKWKKEKGLYGNATIIANISDIQKYEEYYNKTAEYNAWEKDQAEFTKMCRQIGPEMMPTFGYYNYNIPFEKTDDTGKNVAGKYLVWQFFAGTYCFEQDLDYSDFDYIKRSTKNVIQFRERNKHYLPSVYEAIKNFINKIAKEHDVTLYLCASNKEWDAKSLNYHYCLVDGSQFHNLPASIEICDPATESLLFDDILDYSDSIKFSNRHIIVVEMQTDNNHLKEVCSNILAENKEKHPLITYISLLKGLDRNEMLSLIEKKNKEKAEEERKKEEERQSQQKKQSIEKQIEDLPVLLESNNIEHIEACIQYIQDNINFVSEKEKIAFERNKVDYNARKELGIPQKEMLLFVNYDIPLIKSEEGYYAITRMPKKGCIVWPYRRRTIARRGYTEQDFELILKKHLSPRAIVLGDVNILPQDGVRPYEPDIAVVYSENGYNVRIDIEIDEPYAALTNKPTHYIGCGDDYRDANLNALGWIVIRFSEHQVSKHPLECAKYVSEIIKNIDSNFEFEGFQNIPSLEPEKQWTKIESQKMAQEMLRQKYLNHRFGKTDEAIYTNKDLKLTPFETSIIDKVDHTIIGKPIHSTTIIEEDCDSNNNILYNKTNAFEQDKHIEFNPDKHIYTIDGIQYRSVSSVISDLFPEFDSDYWSSVKGRQRGVASQKVAEEWDSKGRQSREVGTFLHQQIENYFLKKPIEYEYHYVYQGAYIEDDCTVDIYSEFCSFKEFLNEVAINPFRSEWRIFDKSLKLAGTIDLISKNEEGTYDIYDWKRSSRLFQSNPYQSGFGRLCSLEDTPRNHYYLQQNLYKYILEHQYGLKIHSMSLVGLHPSYGSFKLIDVPEMAKEISWIIQMM